MDGGAQVEGLVATAAHVTVCEACAHRIQDRLQVADGLALDQHTRIFQRLADLLAAGHLAEAGVAGVVGDEDDVAGEERRVGTGQVQQHAVPAGDRDHTHAGDDGGAHLDRLNRR